MNTNTNLKVTLIQMPLAWEDAAANFDYINDRIYSLTEKTDVIVLPEMFSTGFSMNPEQFAETMDGNAITHMRKWAAHTQAAIGGSLMMKLEDTFVNRFVWIEPNGKIACYDKAHLFRMGEEQMHYAKGNSQVVINYKGWKIAPFVCYDLRFPVWIRRTTDFDYDLIIFVANWPERRQAHWEALLTARAIENQSYLVAVNRMGADGNEVSHSGFSKVLSPLGQELLNLENKETMQTILLSKEELLNYRETFPVGLDTDNFELKT